MSKYKEPYKPVPRPRIVTEASQFHEMKSKFRFTVSGTFEKKGEPFQREMMQMCRNLELVGWLKCRKGFAVGHLQGDIYALSYMKRWLDRDETRNGRIQSVSFFDENFGIPAFDFKNLVAVYDRRSPSKKKMHSLMLRNSLSSVRLKKASDKRNFLVQQFLDQGHV